MNAPKKVLKALIIDDGEADRLYLKGLLKKKFGIAVAEAGNGLEGLQLLEKELPDFVLLDINMPVMNGQEVLTAIRSDRQFAHLPVIVLTAVKSKSIFKDLISLGVTDYILKPLEYEFAVQRFNQLVEELKSSAVLQGPHNVRTLKSDANKLLVVDADPNFTKFVANILGRRFEVLEASTGAAALELYLQARPLYVCIAEKLPLLNEILLATKIRAVSHNSAKLFLFTDSDPQAIQEKNSFDGLMPKSFVPDVFLQKFAAIALGGEAMSASHAQIIKDHMPSEIFKAVSQTFGIMAGIDLTIVNSRYADKFDSEVFACTPLCNREDKITINVRLVSSFADASWLAEQVLSSRTLSRSETMEVFQEILHTVAGRLRSAFEHYNIMLEELPSTVHGLEEEPSNNSTNLTLVFRSSNDKIFIVTMEQLIG